MDEAEKVGGSVKDEARVLNIHLGHINLQHGQLKDRKGTWIKTVTTCHYKLKFSLGSNEYRILKLTAEYPGQLL